MYQAQTQQDEHVCLIAARPPRPARVAACIPGQYTDSRARRCSKTKRN